MVDLVGTTVPPGVSEDPNLTKRQNDLNLTNLVCVFTYLLIVEYTTGTLTGGDVGVDVTHIT